MEVPGHCRWAWGREGVGAGRSGVLYPCTAAAPQLPLSSGTQSPVFPRLLICQGKLEIRNFM